MHEAKLHEENSFVTLTYAPSKLPPHGSLCYRDVQLFFKRLRKERGRFRYFVCGEYGEELKRPHYHALLFGLGFPDRVRIKKSGDNELFESPALARLWTHGFVSIGAVTEQSARYVADYGLKKVGGSLAKYHYERMDPDTGELIQLEPEFVRMSLKPGIGAGFFFKFFSDIYPRGRVIVKGKEVPPPRYYEKLYEKKDPDGCDALRADREFKIYQKHGVDDSSDRLATRHEVAKAVQRLKKREL